ASLPMRLEEFVLAHYSIAVPNEVNDEVEPLRLDVNGRAGAPHLLSCDVNLEIGEAEIQPKLSCCSRLPHHVAPRTSIPPIHCDKSDREYRPPITFALSHRLNVCWSSGTASRATAELYLFRKLLSPRPDGSRSKARARRDLAHARADQGPARKQALLSSLAFPAIITIIVGMVTWSNEYFPKFGSKAGLDRMDVTILGLLQNNARLSVKEIAAEVALAPSSTHERIKRMR